MFKLFNKKSQLLDPSAVLTSEECIRLMRKVQSGDTEAFAMLFTHFKTPIYSYCLSMVRIPSVAQELAQEVFLRAYRVRSTYRPSAKFSTWLWQIARNVSLDHLRKSSTQKELPQTDTGFETVPDDSLNAEEALIDEAKQSDLEDCMSKLSTQQKDVFLLRILQEVSYEEIAEQVESTLSSVKSLLFRAKQSLLECLKKKGKYA